MIQALSKLMHVHFKSRISDDFRLGDILSCVADLEKSKNILGYKPSVSLEDGLTEFLLWSESCVTMK